jgi:DNA modification methylase
MPDSGIPETVPAVKQQRYEAHVPLDRLTPHPANFNDPDQGLLSELLEANGFAGAVIAQESTGILIDGRTRWLTARDKGMPDLPVIWVDVTDDERDRLLGSWNKACRAGADDESALLDYLRGMAGTARGLDGTGWAGDDMDALAMRLNAGPYPGGGSGGRDDAPDPPDAPVTRRGDLWLLGPDHRVLCGDATDPAAVAELMDGHRAGCLWTDPPHGSDITAGFRGVAASERRAAGARQIHGDDRDSADLHYLLTAAWAAATPHLRPGAPVYVCYSAGPPWDVPRRCFRDAGWLLRETLIWVKDSFVVSNLDYHPQYEPILYGFAPGGTGKLGRRGPRWHGDNTASNVFTYPRPSRSDDHPTRKPAGLIAEHLANSTARGETVLDMFAGSGPVLPACQQLGREARLLDIDPAFVDVICERWVALGGDDPVRAADGAAWTTLTDREPAPA